MLYSPDYFPYPFHICAAIDLNWSMKSNDYGVSVLILLIPSSVNNLLFGLGWRRVANFWTLSSIWVSWNSYWCIDDHIIIKLRDLEILIEYMKVKFCCSYGLGIWALFWLLSTHGLFHSLNGGFHIPVSQILKTSLYKQYFDFSITEFVNIWSVD